MDFEPNRLSKCSFLLEKVDRDLVCFRYNHGTVESFLFSIVLFQSFEIGQEKAKIIKLCGEFFVFFSNEDLII